jgi:hypothetical protein
MDRFLVHIVLPDVFSPNFYQILPRQRDVMNKLMEKNVVLSHSMDMDRKNLWVMIEVQDHADLARVLKSFPIIRHVQVSVHELAYHDSAPSPLPELILN